MSHYGDQYRAERERGDQYKQEARERERQARIEEQRRTNTCGNCGCNFMAHIAVTDQILLCPTTMFDTDV